MRRLLIVLLFTAGPLYAQTQTNTVKWNAVTTAVVNGQTVTLTTAPTYTVYFCTVMSGQPCNSATTPFSAPWTAVGSGLTSTTYMETRTAGGQYAYYITANCSGSCGSGTVSGQSYSVTGESQPSSIVFTTVLSPSFSFTPSSFNYGSVSVGNTSSTGIVLANTGAVNLTWTTFSLSETTDFTITANTCVSPLTPSNSCTITVRFNPASGGGKSSNLTVNGANFGNGMPTVPLTGTGVAQGPQPSFNPSTVTFGSVQIGSSGQMTVNLLDNSGAGSFTWTGLAITGDSTDFTLVSTNCVSPLSAGSQCSSQIQFSPQSAGAKSANLSITGNNFNGTLNLPLTGTGVATAPLFSPSPVAFGSANTGTTNSQVITLTNGNGGALTWTSQAITVDTSDFTLLSTTCASPLATSASCTSTVQFNPVATGVLKGSLTFSGINGGSGTLSDLLQGSGTAPVATFTPTSFAFGSVNDGSTATTTIALQNTGTGSMTWTGLAITVDTTSFTQVSTSCTSPLAASASCSSTVRFNPMSAGAKSGDLTLSGGNVGTVNVALTGTGVATGPNLTVSPTSFAFGSVQVGSSSATTITFTNNGTGSLTWSSLAIVVDTTDFTLNTTTCASPLATSSSCTATVQFNPATAGAKAATLQMSGANYGTGTIGVPLTGTGGASPPPQQPGIQIVSLKMTVSGTREQIVCTYTDSNPGIVSHYVIFQNNVLRKQGNCNTQLCSFTFSDGIIPGAPHCGVVDAIGASASQ